MADAEQVIKAWRADLRAGWGEGPHDATLDRLDPVVRDLVAGSAEPAVALARLGAVAGHDGHPLDLVWAWLQSLFERLPSARRAELDQRVLAVAVAAAWANGVLEGSAGSGPARSPAMLELRLRQVYDHCATLGLRVDEQYALVVVDVVGAGAAAVWLPDVVGEMVAAFGHHEVVALLRPNRVAMVVARHPSVANAVQELHVSLAAVPALQGAELHAWVEPLAPDPSHLGGHLSGLRT